MTPADSVTPMMRQYQEIKAQHADCLILFRLGDFYELFEEDAKLASELLGIVLTSRDGKIPMAGVPHHALDQYLAKLVEAGYKVAICEQTTEPNGRTLVQREVVRIVSPGTLLDEHALQQKENNYLVALDWQTQEIGLAVLDLSTGEFRVTAFLGKEQQENLQDELTRLQAVEALLAPKVYSDPAKLGFLRLLVQNLRSWESWEKDILRAQQALAQHWKVTSLQGFGFPDGSAALVAAANILAYVQHTQKSRLEHLQEPRWYSPFDTVVLDRSTLHNLELFETLRSREKVGSLLRHLDHTSTSMGGRLLRHWLRHPLKERVPLEKRLDAVEELHQKSDLREKLQERLRQVGDIERLLSRLATSQANARDLVRLRISLEQIREIQKLLQGNTVQEIMEIAQELQQEKAEYIAKVIAETIQEEPSVDTKSGGIIREGCNPDIDLLRQRIQHSQSWILELEQKERESTGISSLKIRSNKVFGFYIEVTSTHKHKVPSHYERKQTLVNCERFITPELKEQEALLLTAEEEGNRREYELFLAVVRQVLQAVAELQKVSAAVARLDCYANLAQLAQNERYTRPILTEGGGLLIQDGRHPVVEKLLEKGRFVPNDTLLDTKSQQLILLTGPNMAGKSVYMRQVALIVLLAQMGSFVPAKKAEISLVDRIFVRSGASDSISTGLSTFMLEMVETAYILRHATPQSLVVMDEIGRGTSTYDGISLAWSIAEYLVTTPEKRAKTLFATHYHELQELSAKYPEAIRNMHLEVQDEKGEPVFLHRLQPGGASHSFGIAVARLAGVPGEVTQQADSMLAQLEMRQENQATASPVDKNATRNTNTLHPVLKELQKLDVLNVTPLEALNQIVRWKERI